MDGTFHICSNSSCAFCMKVEACISVAAASAHRLALMLPSCWLLLRMRGRGPPKGRLPAPRDSHALPLDGIIPLLRQLHLWPVPIRFHIGAVGPLCMRTHQPAKPCSQAGPCGPPRPARSAPSGAPLSTLRPAVASAVALAELAAAKAAAVAAV